MTALMPYPDLDLADRSVLFRQTWDERVRSGTGVFSRSKNFPANYYGIPANQPLVTRKSNSPLVLSTMPPAQMARKR